MDFTNKQLNKHFGHLEDHQYKHYNHALGCQIYSKEHYIYEMKRQGMIPYEEGLRQAEEWESKQPESRNELSGKARRLINHMRLTAKNGYIKLSDYPKAVKELESMGVMLDIDKIPEDILFEG